MPNVVDAELDVLGRDSELGADSLGHCPGAEIWRRRLYTGLGNEDGPGFLGLLLVLGDHLADPGDLSRHVDIVRPVLGACLERMLAELGVRSNCRKKDTCLLCQGAQVLIVEASNLSCYT